MRRPGSRLVLLLALSLAACSQTEDAPGDTDASVTPGVDASVDPGVDAGSGPPGVDMPDIGSCETWGLDDEGEAITGLTPNQWTFVPFEAAHCMNGTSTGIGINLAPDSNRLVIYMEGGGACFDELSCSMVAGRNGFNADTLASSASRLSNYGIFSRDDTDNPVRDWTFVYVPYCSGDAHAGINPRGTGNREQVGFANMHEYLRRLVPTFRDVEVVLLTGASGGGLGALANYDQTAQAFGCTPVHLLDDSGPVLADQWMKPCLQSTARRNWDLQVPSGCATCEGADGGGMSQVWGFLAQRYPDRRIGLTGTMADQVFRNFFGWGYSPACNFPSPVPPAEFEAGMLDLRDRIMAPYDNIRTFYAPGTSHTFLGGDLGTPTQGGVTLGQWIGQLIEGDEAWSHVGPS